MKHNYVGEDVKKIALNEYLEGDLPIKCIAAKYGISPGNLYLYKKKNDEYVKEYLLKLANQKNDIIYGTSVININTNPTPKININIAPHCASVRFNRYFGFTLINSISKR